MDVGVAIEHPRISDLALTLISPKGKRILLFENRGATNSDLGNVWITTNYFGTVASGDFNASTNIIPTLNPAGILVIDFDFYQAPDSMDVYYEGTNIFSSGLISGAGSVSIPFGPGTETSVTVVINKDNNPNYPGTVWTYTPRVITQMGAYFTFSENTNFTRIPVKFAMPPFLGGSNAIPADVTVLSGPGFNPANSHYYYAIGSKTWSNAASAAVSMGGYLATINDAAENDWVYTNVISLDPDRNAWIGLQAPLPTGPWTWVSGQTPAYTNWAPGEPDDAGDPPYGVSILPPNSTAPSQWNGASTTNALPAVVELDVLPSTHTNKTFYFPEESLKELVGDNALGDWKLEIWDSRAGATNPAPQLLSLEIELPF